MSIHYEKPFDYDAIVQKFAEQQPRRMCDGVLGH